jgi:hypothetical protein
MDLLPFQSSVWDTPDTRQSRRHRRTLLRKALSLCLCAMAAVSLAAVTLESEPRDTTAPGQIRVHTGVAPQR